MVKKNQREKCVLYIFDNIISPKKNLIGINNEKKNKKIIIIYTEK